MKDSDTKYTLKTLARLFNNLPHEQQQQAWLKFSGVMQGYAEDKAKDFRLIRIGELEEDIKEHYASFGQMQGLSSGYRSIDNLTKGLVAGEVTVIAGRTSHGKSAMAINMATKIAMAGHTVLFVTLEMTKVELGSRIYHVYKDDLSKLQILFQLQQEMDWQSVDGLINEAKKNGAEVVFIDHLHYFTREIEHVVESLSNITKELKKNADKHEIPIVLMSHVRKSGNRKDEMDNEELKGTSSIAQDADVILFVHRDKDIPDKIAVQITKNRNRGYDYRNDKILLNFDKTKITELHDGVFED